LKHWLIVSDVPLDRYSESAINSRLSDLDWVSRAAVAHEAVVEAFIDQPALVPMKLFTIFSSDERASDHIRSQSARIEAAINRVRGRVEYGVRVSLDRAQPAPASGRVRTTSGSAYLAGKKAQRDQSAEIAGRARETVTDLFDELSGLADDSVKRTASDLPVKGGPLLLDAAFLVRRTRAARFRAVAGRAARNLAAKGYRVTMSGPWPPYTFMRD
jgi:hypothetical protein